MDQQQWQQQVCTKTCDQSLVSATSNAIADHADHAYAEADTNADVDEDDADIDDDGVGSDQQQQEESAKGRD